MSMGRLKMKKIRELLRLKLNCQLSNRTTAKALGLSASTISYYTRAAQRANLSWPLSEDMDDTKLNALLEPHCQQFKQPKLKQSIDFANLHQELKRKGVTLQLLWEEYLLCKPSNPYSYSQFCSLYRHWRQQLKPSLRQIYQAGEKTFVDYAGPKVPIFNPETGESKDAVIFIAVLAASNYTYAEATASRSSADWLNAHMRMFEFFGGVSELVIPDNEKSGTTKASRYEPILNQHYEALGAHYDTTFLPTRPAKPKDKAKVECAVLVVERWILAKLRHQKFFSLGALNQAIAALLPELNHRPFKKLSGSRFSAYEQLDKPALKPLPLTCYAITHIQQTRVRLDYHIEVFDHFYSVPHTLINQVVDYQTTASTLEIFHNGKRVAMHLLSQEQNQTTTIKEHMPEAHRQHLAWTPLQFLHWANLIGEKTIAVTEHLIETQPHPECCYRIHLGLKKLQKRFGDKSLEAACDYALQFAKPGFHSIESILKNNLHNQLSSDCMNDEADEDKPAPVIDSHSNIRGTAYYQSQPFLLGEFHVN